MEPGLPGGTAPTALGVSNSAQTVKKSVPLAPKSYLFTDTSDVVMTLLYTGSLVQTEPGKGHPLAANITPESAQKGREAV